MSIATRSPVTDQHIAHYVKSGFVRVNNIISKEEAARFAGRAVSILDERKQSGDFGGGQDKAVLRQVVNVWPEDPTMKELTLHPNIVAAAKALAGVPLRLWHDQILIKTPHNNAPTEFHQDQPYWPHKNAPNPISAWIALVDVPAERGCMTFIPESQNRDDLGRQDLEDKRSLFGLCPELEWEERVTIPLRAGDCTFHHGRCPHMANANDTDETRVAHVAIFMDRDTIYDGRPHVITTDRGYAVGQPFPDDAFPPV